RRRHTRWPRDWSSDVCSSDLDGELGGGGGGVFGGSGGGCTGGFGFGVTTVGGGGCWAACGISLLLPPAARPMAMAAASAAADVRSEERRVGKGCRVREREGG